MNMMHRHRQEALRRLRANKYELTEAGVLIPGMGLHFHGHWETQIGDAPWQVDPNIVVNEGILHFLQATLDQAAQNAAFYVALFSGAVTPAATWTAANFVANATEFTNYAEATRVPWNNDPAAANAIGNTTNPAVFTIGAGGGTIRGAALLSASAKNATTGVLIAAARFSADKPMSQDEELRIRYVLSGSST